MPQTSLGELFTSVMNTVPNEETLEAKANTANPVFTGSISLGRKASTTVGTNSLAIGYNTTASGNYSQAMGDSTTASGKYSHTEGYDTSAAELAAHAEGYTTKAQGRYSHSENIYTIADGYSTHASGVYNKTMTIYPDWTANTSYAVGDGCAYSNFYYKCIQANNDSEFDASKWAISYYINSKEAFVVGNGTANNARSNALTLDWTGDLHLMGDLYTGANADGTGGTKLAPTDTSTLAPKASPVFTGSISLGRKANTTVGDNSFAVGNDVEASGVYSHAEGSSTAASGIYSHAEGYADSNASVSYGAKGKADHVEGYNTKANSGTSSLDYGAHAEGNSTQALKGGAHAEGWSTTASGDGSHAEGKYSTAQSDYSHAEGYNATASNINAHAEGDNTTASGITSHAEGRFTTASGNYGSHAEGNYTTASGKYSHAEGSSTTANGSMTHASGSYNQLMQSIPNWTADTQYNVNDLVLNSSYYRCIEANNDSTFDSTKWEGIPWDTIQAFVVGNGINSNNKSNALTLDWTGDLHLAGDIYTGANADGTGGTKLARIPDAPSTDGTYTLQCVVSSGVPTYSWISTGA